MKPRYTTKDGATDINTGKHRYYVVMDGIPVGMADTKTACREMAKEHRRGNLNRPLTSDEVKEMESDIPE